MYRYLLPTYCGEYRGAFLRIAERQSLPRSPAIDLRSLACVHMLVVLPAIPTAPRVAPNLIEEKLALLCRGLIILRNVLGPQARKRETRGRRLQNFIVCHAEINNKTDLIPYDLYNIFSPSRLNDTYRVAPKYAYMYMCACV